jgi:hypothetical protein
MLPILVAGPWLRARRMIPAGLWCFQAVLLKKLYVFK